MSQSQFTFPLIHNAVAIMTPILLASIGGLFTELGGMLNIALEGLLIIGAFFSVVFASVTESIFLGVILGICATVLVALMFGAITLYLKANVFITGLATNLFASGLTIVLAFQIYGNKGIVRFPNIHRLSTLDIGNLQRIPVLGDIFLGHNMFVYISWLLVILAYIVIYKTSFGMRLRGSGLNPSTIVSLGLSPRRYQLWSILISGLTCGLGGAFLTLNLGAFIPNISSGRGWIALVAIYLGNKTPLGVLLASFVFGFAEAFSNYAQGAINVPADFILSLPYIITVITMVGFSIYRYYRGLSSNHG